MTHAIGLVIIALAGARSPAPGREPALPPKPPSPAKAARDYLAALEVKFTADGAGEVTGAMIHCTSDLTDADLALFHLFPELERLTVVGTRVTDDGLAHLKHLPELQDLTLYREHFTAAGMAHLKGVKKLRRLTLTRAEPTDDWFLQLAGVKGLEYLAVSGQKVTTTELGHLKALPAPHTRSFRRSGFADADADARAFTGFPKLAKLQLGQCRVTKAGLEKFREVLPGATVGY